MRGEAPSQGRVAARHRLRFLTVCASIAANVAIHAPFVLAALLAAAPLASPAPVPASAPASSAAALASPAPASPAPSPLGDHLTRDLPRSARHLDHGVLAAGLALGAPHRYRLALTLGLLDHLTLGATAHWLPGQRAPGWSPLVALALLRRRWLNLGLAYFQLLYPPPVVDLDPATLSFQRRAHYLVGTLEFSQGWVSGGLDVGWARGREPDPFGDLIDPVNQTPLVRDRLGGGLHLRLGTRAFGLLAQVTYPFLSAELALEARFGLFERRAPGRWSDL